MTIEIPSREQLEALLAKLKAEPDSPDRTAAIVKVEDQIAHLSEWDAIVAGGTTS
jgi:hypothetical protein